VTEFRQILDEEYSSGTSTHTGTGRMDPVWSFGEEIIDLTKNNNSFFP
jgi:hypothetical protein